MSFFFFLFFEKKGEYLISNKMKTKNDKIIGNCNGHNIRLE